MQGYETIKIISLLYFCEYKIEEQQKKQKNLWQLKIKY